MVNTENPFSFGLFSLKPLAVQLRQAGRLVGVLCSGQEVYLLLLKGTLKVTAPMAHNPCHRRRAKLVGTNIGTG